LSEAVKLVEVALQLEIPLNTVLRERFWHLVDVYTFHDQLSATNAADIVRLASESDLAPIPDHIFFFLEECMVANETHSGSPMDVSLWRHELAERENDELI
jgi:hypothetical protein